MHVNALIIPHTLYAYGAAVLMLIWGLYEKKHVVFWSICMLIIGMQLPLLSAFGLYFIGQNSLNGWSHLKQGMQAGNKPLFVKALPFTLGAALLLGLVLCMSHAGMLPRKSEQWLSVFFVFLACLSMPHVWAMHRFYLRIKL